MTCPPNSSIHRRSESQAMCARVLRTHQKYEKPRVAPTWIFWQPENDFIFCHNILVEFTAFAPGRALLYLRPVRTLIRWAKVCSPLIRLALERDRAVATPIPYQPDRKYSCDVPAGYRRARRKRSWARSWPLGFTLPRLYAGGMTMRFKRMFRS
jgi:hypothetical protein